MITGIVFGTFDGLHQGHDMMLREARMRCDRLVACVPEDDLVVHFKARPPVQTFEERKAALLESGLVDDVIPSDREPGTYGVIDVVQPNIILFGYDQADLRKNLTQWLKENGRKIPTIGLQPFQPDNYKSSLLRFQ